MEKKSRKIRWIVITLASVICGLMAPSQMVFAKTSEVFLEENMREGQEDVLPPMVEYGILVINNHVAKGEIILETTEGNYTLAADYGEYEVPIEEECTIKIQCFSGYEVGAVVINGESFGVIDNTCRFPVESDYCEISIEYVEVDIPENKIEVPKEKSGDSSAKEEEGNYVMAISYDVTVTYLEDEQAVTENPTVEETVEEDITRQESHSTKDDFVKEVQEEEKKDRIQPISQEVKPAEITEIEITKDKDDSCIMNSPKDLVNTEKTNVKKDDNSLSSQEKIEIKSGKMLILSKSDFTMGIPTKNQPKIKEKSVLILSKFPLYLLAVCCMMLVKLNTTIKNRRSNKWIEEHYGREN